MADTVQNTPAPFDEVTLADWRARVEAELGQASFEKRLVTRTSEELPIQPLYSDRDVGATELPVAAAPGWEVHAEYDASDPARARAEIEADLARGVRGVRLSRVSAGTLSELLGAVDLAATAVFPGAALRDEWLELAATRGIPLAKLRGGLGLDPLAALAEGGAWPVDEETARRELVERARWAASEAPGLRVATASSTVYQRAGAGAAQQVALALAAGTEYLRWMTDAGLGLDLAARQLELEVSLGTDFFLELAKLRALRLAWARLVAASGGGPDAQRARIHARTSERSWSACDPWVNLLRGTTESFAAALGGADSIVTLPFDHCLGRSDELARRLATNTQAILAEESHAARVRDAAAGSGYLEALTDGLAREAWTIFRGLEKEGGLAAGLASGSVRRAVAEVREREEQAVAKRRHELVGVSAFPDLDEERLARPPIEPAPPPPGPGLSPSRLAELFEELRARSDRHLESTGQRPTAFLANLGAIPEHRARATFAANLFAAGGIQSLANDGFDSPAAAAEAFAASGAKLCAICSTDERYAEAVPALAPLLVEKGATVIVAGRPGAAEARWREAGVACFIYLGCDALSLLGTLLGAAGVEA